MLIVPRPEPAELLKQIAAALPGGETRAEQEHMVRAVATALATGHHLLVQAGTGVGKSLGYLVPAVSSGRKTIVSTSTKALQEQLVGKDLPAVAEALAASGADPLRFALLKGRSNYYCRVRGEDAETAEQLALDAPSLAEEVASLVAWAGTTDSGDRAELDPAPSERAWAAVSMSPGECPGGMRCPRAADCFSEHARAAAAQADVVVVNHHLLALNMETNGVELPEADVVVVDEAHDLLDVVSSVLGVDLSAPSLERMRARVGGFLRDDAERMRLAEAIAAFEEAIDGAPEGRMRAAPDDVVAAGVALDTVLAAVGDRLTTVRESAANEEAETRALALSGLVASLRHSLSRLAGLDESSVAWFEGGTGPTHLRIAPLDVTEILRDRLFAASTVVATSATLAVGGDVGFLATKWGLAADDRVEPSFPATARPPGDGGAEWSGVDVGTPFDYANQAMLYVPAHLPAPSGATSADHRAAVVEELAALIPAAGGRTLALFTSTRAAQDAAAELAGRLDVPILVQGSSGAGALLAQFNDEEESCLFATTGFWQGVDVPGRSCSLVTIDRLPFPRPDDPLAQARREAAGASGFTDVYVARAAILLAQGVGRLIRSRTDRGVVAVLDPRLATARYGALIRASLPPSRMWTDREAVLGALSRLAASYDA